MEFIVNILEKTPDTVGKVFTFSPECFKLDRKCLNAVEMCTDKCRAVSSCLQR